MTSHSMTFGHPARRSAAAPSVWLAAGTALLLKTLHRLDQWQLGLRQEEPQSAQDVLDRAKRIEASEPGFASDLRAAAMRSMDAQRDPSA